MEPSDLRLLRGANAKLTRLSSLLSDPEQVELAATASFVLRELLKRHQLDFFAESCRRVREILERSIRLEGFDDPTAMRVSEVLSRSDSPDIASLRSRFSELYSVLSSVVDVLAAHQDQSARAILDEIVAWEARLVAPYDDVLPASTILPTEDISQALLQSYLRARVPGWDAVTVENFRRLPGGYSKITILFDTHDPSRGRQSFVLRAAQHGTPFFMDGADISSEFPAICYAFEHGIPVAEPIHVEEDPALLGSKFLISRRAPGCNFGSVTSGSSQLSEELVKHLVGVLARIHATPIDRSDPLFRRSHFARWARFETLAKFTPAYIDYWTRIADQCGALSSPAIRRGLAWLRAKPPASALSPVLVHGDFGLHNTMIENGRVSAVLDWEASHIGDPADEFFLFSHAVGGVVDRPTLMRWYEEAGGQLISTYRLRYFDVVNCLKGPIVGYGSLNMAERHPTSDIKTCLVGFQYVAMQLQSLNAMIALAESTPRDEAE